jgi:monothiol glutaredoxin
MPALFGMRRGAMLRSPPARAAKSRHRRHQVPAERADTGSFGLTTPRAGSYTARPYPNPGVWSSPRTDRPRQQPMDAKEFIQKTVTEHPVVLFMKGTAQFPQCGFSGRAIQLLKQSGVKNLITINVLDDDDVRQGVKEYANWPTIPQLYVKGEFVGGSDIMMEMFQSGELAELLKKADAV